MADFTPAGINAIVNGLSGFLRDLGKMDKAILNTSNSADQSSGAFGKMSSALGGVATVAGGVLVAGVAAATTATIGLGKAGLDAAISFESAFAGVLKTTKTTVDEAGNLTEVGKELRQGFRDLSLEIPVAVEELAAIGELGGQLGIAEKDLLGFTDTIAKIAVSTNLTTESAATDLARLNNIYGDVITDVAENTRALGATIVELGNNSATTEKDIVNFATRIAGAGKIAGLSQADILAIGASFSSVGIQAEAGGTAVQKVLLEINDAVSNSGKSFVDNSANISKFNDKLIGLQADLVRLEAKTGLTEAQMRDLSGAFQRGEISAEEWGRQLGDTNREALFNTITKLDETRTTLEQLKASQGQPVEPKALSVFAKTAGLTAEEFKEAWETDASEAFTMFVEGLGQQGDAARQTLAELGLEDQRLIRSFLSLAGAGDQLRESLKMANIEFGEADALNQEAAQRFKTTESQIALLKNTFNDVAISIGDILLPRFNLFLTNVSDLVEQNRPLIINFFERISEITSDVVPKAIELSEIAFSKFNEIFTSKLIPSFNQFITFVEPIRGFLADQIPQAINLANLAFDKISQFIESNLPIATDFAITSFNNLNDIIFQDLIPTLQSIKDSVEPTIVAIATNLPEALIKAQEIIGIASEFITQNLPVAIDFAKQSFEVITEFINTEVTIAFQQLNVAFNALNLFWQKNGERIKILINDVFFVIGETLSFLSGQVVPFLLEQFQKIQVFWDENGPLITDTIVVLGEAFLTVAEVFVDQSKVAIQAIQAFWEISKPIIDGTVDILLNLAELIAEVITGDWAAAWQTASEIVDTTINSLNAAIIEFLDQIAMAMGSSLEEIRTTWEGVWDLIKQSVDLAIDNIISLITTERDWEQIGFDAMSALLEGISQIMLDIVAFFETSADDWESSVNSVDWVGLGEAVIEQILDGVEAIADDVSDKFDEIAKNAKKAFEKAVEWIKVGKDMVEGMVLGIEKAKEKIFGALASLAQGAINAIKAALGISSPSKVFAEFGRNIVEGLVLGVDTEKGSFKSVLDNLFDIGRKFTGFGFAQTLEDKLEPFINSIEESSKEVEKLEKQIFKLQLLPDPNEDQLSLLDELLSERDSLLEKMKITQDFIAPDVGALMNFKQAKQTRQFLEDQLSLFELINESGIDATDIIDSLNFGVNASVKDFVRAQGDILNIINKEIESQLLVESTLSTVKKGLSDNKKQLSFLKMQSSLLDTIASNGLDARKILGDIKLGEGLTDVDLLKIQNKLTSELIKKEKERLNLILTQDANVDVLGLSIDEAEKIKDLFLGRKLGFSFDGLKVAFSTLLTQQDLFFDTNDLGIRNLLSNLDSFSKNIKKVQTQSSDIGSLFDLIVESGIDVSEIFGDLPIIGDLKKSDLANLSARNVFEIQERLAEKILEIERQRLATQIERLDTIEEEQRLFEQQQALEQSQARLRFLEQQQKLLVDIEEAGFNADAILQGFQVGVDANQSQFLAVLTRFTDAMIAQVESDLGIASPSKVFADIGENLSAGMAVGISRSSMMPQIALSDMVSGLLPQSVEAPSTITNNNISFNNNVSSNMDVAVLENMLLQVL